MPDAGSGTNVRMKLPGPFGLEESSELDELSEEVVAGDDQQEDAESLPYVIAIWWPPQWYPSSKISSGLAPNLVAYEIQVHLSE